MGRDWTLGSGSPCNLSSCPERGCHPFVLPLWTGGNPGRSGEETEDGGSGGERVALTDVKTEPAKNWTTYTDVRSLSFLTPPSRLVRGKGLTG